MPVPPPQVTRPPASPRRMAVVVASLIAIMIALVSAFALPSIHSAPKDVPVSIVAPAAQRAQLESALNRTGADAWDYRVAATEAGAERQILDRTVYAAFVVTKSGLTLDYASAASATVATSLTQLANGIGAADHIVVHTDDIRPFTHRDPKGSGLAAGALPIALGGWIAAVGIISLIVGTWQRLATAAGFAVVGGLALIGVLFAYGTLDGNYVGDALSAMLGIGATSFLVLGLQRFLKSLGIAIAAVILILLGNPLSGLGSAPELLPRPWGSLGQLLPPGATGTLLRNVTFFDGHAIALPITALALWLVAGALMYWLGTRRDARPAEHGRHCRA